MGSRVPTIAERSCSCRAIAAHGLRSCYKSQIVSGYYTHQVDAYIRYIGIIADFRIFRDSRYFIELDVVERQGILFVD